MMTRGTTNIVLSHRQAPVAFDLAPHASDARRSRSRRWDVVGPRDGDGQAIPIIDEASPSPPVVLQEGGGKRGGPGEGGGGGGPGCRSGSARSGQWSSASGAGRGRQRLVHCWRGLVHAVLWVRRRGWVEVGMDQEEGMRERLHGKGGRDRRSDGTQQQVQEVKKYRRSEEDGA